MSKPFRDQLRIPETMNSAADLEPNTQAVSDPSNDTLTEMYILKLQDPGVYTFWRGRVALYGILKGLGIGPGDGVIVPGYTCSAVPATVQFAGAEPVYADIAPDSFNLSFTSCRSVAR